MTQVRERLNKVPTKLDWLLPLALALLSLAVSGWSNYNRTDREMSNRVTAVETQQRNDGLQLERIERRVERVDEKVDKVLDVVAARR